MTGIRWPGMPTSGRYVYRTKGGWYWQCDNHPDAEYAINGDEAPRWSYGSTVTTWQEALNGAFAHACVCPYTNDSSPSGPVLTPRTGVTT